MTLVYFCISWIYCIFICIIWIWIIFLIWMCRHLLCTFVGNFTSYEIPVDGEIGWLGFWASKIWGAEEFIPSSWRSCATSLSNWKLWDRCSASKNHVDLGGVGCANADAKMTLNLFSTHGTCCKNAMICIIMYNMHIKFLCKFAPTKKTRRWFIQNTINFSAAAAGIATGHGFEQSHQGRFPEEDTCGKKGLGKGIYMGVS